MAVPARFGLEFLINSTISGAQYDSALLGAVNGQFISLFTDLGSGNTNVRARYFDAMGVPVAADFVINDVLTFNEDSGAIAGLASGRFLAVWTDDSLALPDNSASAIHGQLLSSTGASIGTEFVINTSTAGVQLDPAVTALAGDRFLVSWTDQQTNGLRAQIVNFDGTLTGPEIPVRVAADAVVGESSVAALTGGGALLVWTEQNAGVSSFDADGSGIVAQRLDATGAILGVPFLVNATTADFQFSPKAVALAGGRVAIVWTDASATGGDAEGYAVRARVFESSGAPATGEFLVNTTTAGDQFEAAIAALPDGRFVIAWTDSSAAAGDTDGQAVRARLFTSSGAADSDEFLVNAATTGRQGEPSIAVLADGRFAISWTDESASFADTSESAVVGQIFDPRTAAIALAGTDLKDDFAGTSFADTLSGAGEADRLQGADGDDLLAGGAGGDKLYGGNGIDTASYATSVSAVQVNLSNGVATGGDAANDEFLSIENLTGSALGDALTGNAGSNVLKGMAGNDSLSGGGGKDSLDGGLDSDSMAGGASDDTYFVDAAGDTVTELANEGYDIVNTSLNSYVLGANTERVNFTGSGNFIGTGNGLANRFQSGAGDDRFIDTQGGADIFSGGLGTDVIDFRGAASGAIVNLATSVHAGAAAGDAYSGIERYWGSNSAGDTMTGDAAKNNFYGFGGDDTLFGGGHSDRLEGGAGNDALDGGLDKDVLNGGAGNDTLTGGAAADSFEFAAASFGQDTVTDYVDGADKLKFFHLVADDIADFSIAGNGTTSVLVALLAAPSNTVTLNGAAPITITNADFVFY